jgi:hypothetical protein
MRPRVGLALAFLSIVFPARAGDDRRPAPVYTNDDLDRMRPFRAQTGVTSQPAASSEPALPESPAGADRGEAYWRQEAERLQDRLAPLAARAARLRSRLAELRARPAIRRGAADAQARALQDELDRTEACIRTLEERLHDRARREGALPGWLR